MKPLHIVMIISNFHPIIGGGEKQAERLARGLVGRGHRVTVLTRWFPGLAPTETLAGIEVVRVGGTGRWGATTAMLRWLWRYRRGIDILHAHQSHSPLVVGAVAARLWGMPLLCTPMTHMPELRWLQNGRAGRLRRWLFARTDLWIAKSAEIDGALSAYAPGRVLRIANGVDTEKFAPGALAVGQAQVVFVGRLDRPKRVDLLLAAWARLNLPARLLIVGDGPLRPEWQRQAADAGLQNVEFIGNRSDIAAVLQASTLFVLPSDLEGMPNALLEAMSSGLACVATGVGAVPELLGDQAGLIVDPGDIDGLVRGMRELLVDADRRARMGQCARQRVIGHYSMAAVAETVEAAYHRAMALEE